MQVLEARIGRGEWIQILHYRHGIKKRLTVAGNSEESR
jgi:hypothetical protein